MHRRSNASHVINNRKFDENILTMNNNQLVSLDESYEMMKRCLTNWYRNNFELSMLFDYETNAINAHDYYASIR
jgi:hypothetical protein